MSDIENRSSLIEIKDKNMDILHRLQKRFKRTVIDCGKTLTTPA